MAFASWLITPNGRLDPTSAVPFSPADSSKRWNKLSRLNVTYQCADIFFYQSISVRYYTRQLFLLVI